MSLTTRVSIIPQGNPNRPGAKLKGGSPSWITVHETANTAAGANAEMHRRFVHGGGGPQNVSFHAVVDDHESIQLLPWDEVGWHAGDGNGDGNRDSVGIETCVNRGSNWAQTLQNLAMLVAGLMKEYNIPLTRVKQHNFWSGKNCPTNLRIDGWDALIAQIGLISSPLPTSPQQALEAYYNANGGVPAFGLPLQPYKQQTIGGRLYLIRNYERARLECDMQTLAITRGLVNAELLACKGEL